MIHEELGSLGCVTWEPALGGNGVVSHSTKPSIFDSEVLPVVDNL